MSQKEALTLICTSSVNTKRLNDIYFSFAHQTKCTLLILRDVHNNLFKWSTQYTYTSNSFHYKQFQIDKNDNLRLHTL